MPELSGAGLVAEELFEEETGETTGVMAEDPVFLEEIIEDDAEAELLERGEVDSNGFGASRAITTGHVGRNGLAIGNDEVDDALRDVLQDRAKMIGQRVASGFVRLEHQVGDLEARRPGGSDGGTN